MAAKDILSGLLSRQNQGGTGGTFKDIAADYFSGSSSDSKRRRNVILGTMLFGAKEASMENKVLKNIEANEKEKTFKLAGLTQKWDAYSNLINDDRSYQKNNNYFFRKAEDQWTEINPNYDNDTKGADINAAEVKNKEIADLEKRLIEIHNNKIKTGNISSKNYMNKETFFRPFEDYYSEKTKDIAAPKNLSVVHNAWDKTKDLFRKQPAMSEEEKQNKISIANRNSYGYLIEPDSIKGDSAILAYREGRTGSDTTDIKMNLSETKINILNLQGVNQEQKNYLVRNLKEKEYTKNQLQAEIISLSADFNPLKEKRLVAGNNFDERYMMQNKKIPALGTEQHGDYVLRKTNYVDIQTKQGNEEINELRSNVFMLKDLVADGEVKNKEAISLLENKIRDASIGKVESMAINTSIQASIDPDIVATLKLQAEGNEEDFEEILSKYQKDTFQGILDFVDSIKAPNNTRSFSSN